MTPEERRLQLVLDVLVAARTCEREFDSGLGVRSIVDLVFAIRAFDKAATEHEARQTCLGCGQTFPPDKLCTLGGGGPVCLPCADRITKAMDETEGPVDG